MALGNRSVLIDNALTSIFGQGYSMRAVKVPLDEPFPDSFRHFDVTGLSFLTKIQTSVRSDNGFCLADVLISYAVCSNCGKIYYRVEDVVVLQEYSQNRSFNEQGYHNQSMLPNGQNVFPNNF